MASRDTGKDGNILEDVSPEANYMPEYKFDDDAKRGSNPIVRFFQYLASWMIPGLGMFSEACVLALAITNIGLAALPTCLRSPVLIKLD